MSVIKVMDISLSNKIAAGEVIEKLMNVVKELVENSVDAKSTEIKIDLIESGITEIKVTDNGVGMEKEDVIRCLERHATSKIYEDDDLFNINTLGFRGEAIPSIASVSKMTIISSKGDIGTKLEVEGGVISNTSIADARQGTTMIVRNIFFNTPARLKYLKSLYSELANIMDYVNKMALSYPNIRFKLTNDEKVLLTTDGTGNLLKVINSIYGSQIASKMIEIKGENSDYEIDGYISYPEVNRASRNNMTVLVNGRVIKNNEINKTILEAYHTYLFKDRCPITAINIKTDPSLIDINIHPTKMDIKFSKLDQLQNLIFNLISTNLEKINLIPQFETVEMPNSFQNKPIINNIIDFATPIEKPQFEEIKLDFNSSVKEESKSSTNEIIEQAKEYPENIENIYQLNEEEHPKEKFIMIEPIGVIHGTYIIGENEIGMFVIDQHAANERINYEYYMREMGKETYEITDLLIPIKIELTKSEFLKLKEHINVLDQINIGYEEFGETTIIIRSHPCFIKKEYVEESLHKIIEIIINIGTFSKTKFIERVATTLSCKMSIKANEQISIEEMRTLIERLRNTDNPFTCPHGRPTIISFTKYELEKMFKRVV